MVSAEIIHRYFPDLDEHKFGLYQNLYPVYSDINARINLISRKDFDNFYIHHVLHSLALARLSEFPSGSRVIDIGTGGGFPGIPLAIMFPDVQFTLVDSIGKKIRAVEEVADALALKNIQAFHSRTEALNARFDMATARAVAPMKELWSWMKGKWAGKPVFYLLKGGDLSTEMNELLQENPNIRIQQKMISDIFSEPFFETKKVILLHGR